MWEIWLPVCIQLERRASDLSSAKGVQVDETVVLSRIMEESSSRVCSVSPVCCIHHLLLTCQQLSLEKSMVVKCLPQVHWSPSGGAIWEGRGTSKRWILSGGIELLAASLKALSLGSPFCSVTHWPLLLSLSFAACWYCFLQVMNCILWNCKTQ